MYVMLLMKKGVLELRSDWCYERLGGLVTVTGVAGG